MASDIPAPMHPMMPPGIPVDAHKKARAPIVILEAVLWVSRTDTAVVVVVIRAEHLLDDGHVSGVAYIGDLGDFLDMLVQFETPGYIPFLPVVVLFR